jgi:mediator of RNA polymerase II transcription subunit 14
MCRSNAPNENINFEGNATFANLSNLERFLGCIYIRKNLQQLIQKQDCPLTIINPTHPSEVGIIQFRDKNELFHFKILMHPETMQNLQIKITSLDKNHSIIQEEIDIIERFLESKVICEPFKPDAFSTFARIISSPFKFIKDFIQLMKLELYPDRNFKWLVNWCLTISPGTLMRNLPVGMSAFLPNSNSVKNTIVFFLQFTQNTLLLNPGIEPQSIAVPIIYDINTNSLNVPVKDQPMSNLPTINIINRILQDAANRSEYPIYSPIREVLCNELIATV